MMEEYLRPDTKNASVETAKQQETIVTLNQQWEAKARIDKIMDIAMFSVVFTLFMIVMLFIEP